MIHLFFKNNWTIKSWLKKELESFFFLSRYHRFWSLYPFSCHISFAMKVHRGGDTDFLWFVKYSSMFQSTKLLTIPSATRQSLNMGARSAKNKQGWLHLIAAYCFFSLRFQHSEAKVFTRKTMPGLFHLLHPWTRQRRQQGCHSIPRNIF